MSGYRVAIGWGNLTRGANEKISDLPAGRTPMQCVASLTGRFGGGLTLSLNRNRNVNYHQDIGQREFTIASTGMYECDWSLEGLFTPQYVEWMEYAFMSDMIKIDKDSKFGPTFGGDPATAVTDPGDGDIGYVVNGSTWCKRPLTGKLFKEHLTLIGSSNMVIKRFGYTNLDGVKTFDLGFVQNNKTASNGGYSEIGVLVGCAVANFSLSYENGADAAVKLSIDGHALCDYIQVIDQNYDYLALIQPSPNRTLVAGCMSRHDGTTWDPIAQTDSASMSISNNLTRLGNCLRTTYSGYAMAALTYSVNTSTYSNNPNKYKAAMYGYATMTPVSGATTNIYFPGKQPYGIPRMRIRVDDTDAVNLTATAFLDILMDDVYIGGLSNTYDVENAIMDQPELRPKHVEVVVGYTAP